MLPVWYVPLCTIVALALVVVMGTVLRREGKDDAFRREVFDKGTTPTYPPMTDKDWEELEERLIRQREFDKLVNVVEEARNDFSG